MKFLDCVRMRVFVPLAALLLCGLLGACQEAKQVAKSPADRRARGSMHQRLNWKAGKFFTDAGVIALCRAIEARDLAKIDELVKSGVDINAKGRGNMTPLLWAFPMGEDVFKKMLDLGADPNVKLTENTLILPKSKSVTFACVELVDGLMYSSLFHDVAMDNYLRLVLEHGGDPNSEDMDGETPLFAAFNYSPHAARKVAELTRFGADLNHRDKQGYTAVYSAAGGGVYDSALVLLQAGADYRIPASNGSDLVLKLQWALKTPQGPGGLVVTDRDLVRAQPLFDWLTKEGVDWDAARAALASPQTMRDIKNLPADYKHRPWLPQRPTLKRPDAADQEDDATKRQGQEKSKQTGSP